MKMETLKDLYVEQLRDMYSAETQLVKALPKMAKSASHEQLKSAFESHLRETETQVERLERIFDDLGEKPGGHKCKGMEGLIEEGNEMAKAGGDPEVRDAGLIAAAQRVEHYEIAGYGCVRTYARMLGRTQDVSVIQKSLDEEGDTDHKLTALAESVINPAAQS
jgi:ferritin-like metal-binding protein YciE